MSTRIKVLPVADAHVGIAHPLDGSLEADGSLWTYDAFTQRQLQARTVRRFEAEAEAAVPEAAAKPAKAAGK